VRSDNRLARNDIIKIRGTKAEGKKGFKKGTWFDILVAQEDVLSSIRAVFVYSSDARPSFLVAPYSLPVFRNSIFAPVPVWKKSVLIIVKLQMENKNESWFAIKGRTVA
jgi:hypothetical protein